MEAVAWGPDPLDAFRFERRDWGAQHAAGAALGPLSRSWRPPAAICSTPQPRLRGVPAVLTMARGEESEELDEEYEEVGGRTARGSPCAQGPGSGLLPPVCLRR